MFDETNYMIETLANWREVSLDEFARLSLIGRAHFESESGSRYFIVGDCVYRQSDHWNACVAACAWFVDGKTLSRLVCGACELAAFRPVSLAFALEMGVSENSINGLKHRLQRDLQK